MNLRRSSVRLAVVAAAAVASLPALARGQAGAQPADAAALAGAIAERLAFAADAASADEATLRAAALLAELARRQRPDEIRFARDAADLWMRVGDRDRAIAALNAVRAIDPKDQLAMVQFVDLTLAGLETAEARQAYAQQIANAGGVPTEVRSHAAVQLMNALSQRGMDAAALAALDQAIALNPQNATALEARYGVLARSGTPADRTEALLRLLEVAPNDPRHIISLAQEAAAAGDFEDAAVCYSLGFLLVGAERQGPPPLDDVIDCVAAQLLAGKPDGARETLAFVAESTREEGAAYSAALLVRQLGGAAEADLRADVADARGVYLARLAGLSALLRDRAPTPFPATRPAAPMPDVVGDAKSLAADDSRGLSTPYAVALAELLWFDAYFRAAPLDDSSMIALRTLIGESDPLVVRLEGWQLLNAGAVEEAKVKFNAIVDRDGFAKLGLAAAAVAQQDEVAAANLLTQVLASRPTGLFGGHVAVAAAKSNVTVPAGEVNAEVSRRAVAGRDLVAAAMGAARDAYLLTAAPLSPAYAFGEPMLAKVSILNIGPRPIAIGPRGLIRPTFAIDTQTRGEGSRGFPATATGRWAGAIRLGTRQSTSQTVRLDRGPLDAFLRRFPTPVITLAAYVTTNPVDGPRGTTYAAGGQQAQVGNVFERRAAPLHVETYRAAIIEQLQKAAAARRLAAAEFIAAVLPELGRQSDNPNASAVRAQLADALKAQAASDSDAATHAWIAAYAAGDDPTMLSTLAGQDDAAATAALTVARALPSATRRAVASAVVAATDPLVAELAAATRDEPEPTTAPSTQP